MNKNQDQFKIDKTKILVSALDDPTDEISYWANKSSAERMAAIELMRQIIYGYDPTSTRLQRVLAITQRA